MDKKPSPWGQQEQEGEGFTLRQVSIKNLYPSNLLPKDDFSILMARGEGLWSAATDLFEGLEEIRDKVTDPAAKKALEDIAREVQKVQRFAFDLTEYVKE